MCLGQEVAAMDAGVAKTPHFVTGVKMNNSATRSAFARRDFCVKVEAGAVTRSNTSLRTLGRSYKCRIIST